MTNNFVRHAKRLLEWNREKLTSQSHLTIQDVDELFAKKFVVIANERKYEANHQNYLEFLNDFRSQIKSIDYQVQEIVHMGSVVVMPLIATLTRLTGKEDIFDAMMLIKFDNSGKIIHWQEVYSQRASLDCNP